MGIVQGYEFDLFVSYAHIDNEPIARQENGWVTFLKENLKPAIDKVAGSKSNIWMDERLASEARFTAPILDALKRSASLLVVATPSYLNSFWCERERSGFMDFLPQLSRTGRPVFIAECEELTDGSLPKEFGDCLPVKFWKRDGDGTAPRRLGYPIPRDEDQDYWSRVTDLAYKVVSGLKRLPSQGQTSRPEQEISVAVFLAEVTDDIMEDNDRVRRSLEQAGLRVLPDRAYPRDTPDAFAAAMREDLKHCKSFVQLLGEYPGRVRGWDKSLSALQFEVAKQAGVEVQQRRRFELKTETIKDEEHRALVFGRNVVNDSLEVFIGDVVKSARRSEEEASVADENSLVVFIDNDKDDTIAAQELYQFFGREGLVCVAPAEFQSAEAMRNELEEDLKMCDGLVLVYGRAQAEWVRQQLRETIKTKGVRQKPLPQVVLCHAAPENDKPDPLIKLPNQRIVDCRHGLDLTAQHALIEFVKSLRGRAVP